MKNFNLFSVFIVVFVLVLGVYSCQKETETTKVTEPILVQSPGFGHSCNPNANNCTPYQHIIIPNLTLANYPGCVFRVQVSICIQQDALLGTEIYVGNYKLLDASNCPDLWEEWSSLVLDPESQPGEINEFVNNIDLQVYARLEDYLYAQHGNIVGCHAPLGTLTVSFIKATCNTMCSYIFKDMPDFPGGLDESFNNNITGSRSVSKYGILVRTNCDTEGCCQRQTKICYNPVTNKVEKTTITHATFNSTCVGGVIDEPDLPGGAEISHCLPCRFSCD